MEEKRNKTVLIKFTEQELNAVERNMKNINVKNRSGYIRKMSIDGYHLTLEMPELPEISRLLNIISNNVNQLTKMAHSTNNIYKDDVLDVNKNLIEIKEQFGEILKCLSKVGG